MTGKNWKDSHRNRHFIKDKIHAANGQMTRRSTPLSSGSNKAEPHGDTTARTRTGWTQRRHRKRRVWAWTRTVGTLRPEVQRALQSASQANACPLWLGARPDQRPVCARTRCAPESQAAAPHARGRERPNCGMTTNNQHPRIAGMNLTSAERDRHKKCVLCDSSCMNQNTGRSDHRF